ncbi:NAD-dependent epimerase/dehydratase family protein [Anaeromyxobacter terrae]|uniref:NAD-dependent epimerase/dehydratase family protein n=1 Tax=Anaeromyxobacter terrae TaxID=2925406 RepID=UPI001F5A3808|nr:NAD-dependent epimerase/dehydratase family protein [Anaeromyxobacter sp. SG22]
MSAGPRVLVTGATGFLGAALARALAREGARVHALSRPGSDRRALEGVPVIWHTGDVGDRETLRAAIEGSTAIVHAAGRLGEAGVPEDAYRRVNVDGTRNVLAAALAWSPGARVLHLSSPGVLGPTRTGPATEDAPYAPATPYERSKAEAEEVARELAGRGLAVVIARPGFIYGPGDRHVLGLFRAVGRGRYFHVDGGRALCQPTFVDDAVAGMLACLRSGRPGRAYHVAGPRAVTFRELADTIAAALGVRPPGLSLPRPAAMVGAAALEVAGRVTGRRPPLSRAGVAFFSEDRVFSCERARAELGWAPEHDLASGVARTVAWYRAQRLL